MNRDFGKYGVGDIINNRGQKARVTKITPLDNRVSRIEYEFFEPQSSPEGTTTTKGVYIHEKWLIWPQC